MEKFKVGDSAYLVLYTSPLTCIKATVVKGDIYPIAVYNPISTLVHNLTSKFKTFKGTAVLTENEYSCKVRIRSIKLKR